MSDQETNPPNERFTCPECHAGHMQIKHIAYFTWLAGELISVPDFPAWICDVCGRREYDTRAISWLNIMLDPNTGRPRRSPKPKIPPQDRPSARPEKSA